MFLAGAYLLLCMLLYCAAVFTSSELGYIAAVWLILVVLFPWSWFHVNHNEIFPSWAYHPFMVTGILVNALILYGLGLLLSRHLRYLMTVRQGPQDLDFTWLEDVEKTREIPKHMKREEK